MTNKVILYIISCFISLNCFSVTQRINVDIVTSSSLTDSFVGLNEIPTNELTVGAIAHVLGTNAINDGGEGFYVWDGLNWQSFQYSSDGEGLWLSLKSIHSQNELSLDSFSAENNTLLQDLPNWLRHPVSPIPDEKTVVTSTGNVLSRKLQYFLSDSIPASADYTVSAVFGYTSTSGLLGRWNANTLNGYMGRWNESSSRYELYRCNNGIFAILGSQNDSTPAAGSVVQLEMTGTTIRVLLDGVAKISVTNSSHSSAGRVGLRVTGTTSVSETVDDFSLIDSSGTTTETFASSSETPLDGYSGVMNWSYHPLSEVNAQGASVDFSSDGVVGTSVEYFLSSFTSLDPDYVVRWSSTESSSSSTGVIFRWSETELSGYMARYFGSASQWQIFRFDAGTPTQIGSFAASTPTGRTNCEVTIVGDTITLTANGVVIGAVTDSTYSAAGRVGLRTGAGNTIHLFEMPDFEASSSFSLPNDKIGAIGWLGKVGSIETQNTGNRLKFFFDGPELALKFENDANISGHILVKINGGDPVQHKLRRGVFWEPLFNSEFNTGLKTCEVILSGNDSVTDNWVTPDNALRITDVHVAKNATIEAPYVLPKRAVFIGDSITRGRSLVDNYRYGDSEGSWAAIVAKRLQVEAEFIAFSGQGVVNGGAGGVPNVNSAIDYYSSGESRSPDGEVDYVFFAHGTNDGTSITSTAYQTAFGKVRTLFPNAKVFVVLPLGFSQNSSTLSTALANRTSWNGRIQTAFTNWGDANSQLIDLSTEWFGDLFIGPLNGSSNNYTSDYIHPNEDGNKIWARTILEEIQL